MLKKLLSLPNTLLALVPITILISFMKLRGHGIGPDGSDINNYLIYKFSFFNLFHGHDLYQAYPNLFYDYFRYSPAFAMLFAPFALLPNWLGLILWNYINIVVLVTALHALVKGNSLKFSLALGIVILECITAMQNSQSNTLIVGLIIWGFVWLERKNQVYGLFAILLAGFIKIYGFAAGILFIFFPKKGRYFLYGAIIFSVFAFSPLFILSVDNFKLNHISWYQSVTAYTTATQLSVMGILQSWFHVQVNFLYIQLAGLFLTLLPLIQIKKYTTREFQLGFLASLLMFLVIFNQMSESATFIIAVAGCAIWFVKKENFSRLDISLLVFMMLCTVLSPTDLIPKVLRKEFFEPYKIKALGVLVIWINVQWELWVEHKDAVKVSHEALLR